MITEAELSVILYKHDLIGLVTHNVPPDEYNPEASTLIKDIYEGIPIDVLEQSIRTNFIKWFGDMGYRIPNDQITSLAEDIRTAVDISPQ